MTKLDAAEKVAKLMRLSRGTSNPHEASTAREQAKKLVEEYQLTSDELSAGKKADAFDDLVEAVRRLVAGRPDPSRGLFDTSDVISNVLAKLTSMEKSDKARRLDEAAKLVEAACLIDDVLSKMGLGGNTLVKNVKKVFDETLRNHNLERT